jgi:hypothetical protein
MVSSKKVYSNLFLANALLAGIVNVVVVVEVAAAGETV